MPVAEYELYKRIKLLGEGSFGKAYLVECLSDGSLCVIKQVDISRMSEQEKKDTLIEAKILEALQHPNIVRFREVYKTKKGRLCIVMDYADGNKAEFSRVTRFIRRRPWPKDQGEKRTSISRVSDIGLVHTNLPCFEARA